MSNQKLTVQQTGEKLQQLGQTIREMVSDLTVVVATGPIAAQSARLLSLSLVTIAEGMLEDVADLTQWLTVQSDSDVILVDKEVSEAAVERYCVKEESLSPMFVELSSVLVQAAGDLLNKAKAKLDEAAALTAADLFRESVSVASRLYYLRLEDPSFDIKSAVPGIKILAQDGALYYVEVPEASHAIFQTLEAEGKFPSPTLEEARRRLEIAEKSSQEFSI